MVSGASWIRRGSYSKRMRCFSRYLANMTSKDDRKAIRLPLTLTRQSYLDCAVLFFMPTVAPNWLVCSLWRQPQDFVRPAVSWLVTTLDSLPQSHRQRQYTRLGFVLSSSISNATSRPNRFPVKSKRRVIPCVQPQEGLTAVNRLLDNFVTAFPQSQRHSHMLWCLQATRSSTTKLPNRLPIKSVVPNISRRRSMLRSIVERTISAFLQPQDVARPFLSNLDGTSFSLPQEQRHNQYAPFVVVCENSKTVNRPKTLPVKSFTLPIATPNNNAASASHVMLSRQHVMHRRRGYQYNTCACCLDKSDYSTERVI